MKETYKASGKANSTTYITYEGTSKRKVIQVIRHATEAYRFAGNSSSWAVYRQDGDCVAAGGMLVNGVRYRYNSSDLSYFRNGETQTDRRGTR